MARSGGGVVGGTAPEDDRDPVQLFARTSFTRALREDAGLVLHALVWHQVEFPKTHDIGRLVELVHTVDPPLADLAREADVLTHYGVEIRYPGDLPEPDPEQVPQALALAERVREAVLQLLPPEVSAAPGEE